MPTLFPSFLKTEFLLPSFLRAKPLIDENTADFIFSTVAWVLQNFDHEEFFNRTRLVAPSNDFFPGLVNSVDEKAQNIFQHTVRYAGLRHWPFELKSMIEHDNNDEGQMQPVPQDELALIHRNSFPHISIADEGADAYGIQVPVIITQQPLFVFYNLQQTLKPEDLSASYAHVIAQHLIIQSKEQPPGGNQFFAEASEILASMMGFGVLLSNSAYTFRGGCGSCYNAMANRQPALTELDSVFTLALFCRLKGIRYQEATRHLKKHLCVSYKQAIKQIDQRLDQVNDLKRIA
tara:strand:+ start:794 stop:1666 length:873 start_codon:yes stop_codon:yes gene_type:complete